MRTRLIFAKTYDGEDSEPIVLPSNFPNLLAKWLERGLQLAWRPPFRRHNVSELCEASSVSDQVLPTVSDEKLFELLPGPDFPTGGGFWWRTASRSWKPTAPVVVGSGCVPKWEKEELPRGAYQIVVDRNSPIRSRKSRLIERIADLIQNRKPALC